MLSPGVDINAFCSVWTVMLLSGVVDGVTSPSTDNIAEATRPTMGSYLREMKGMAVSLLYHSCEISMASPPSSASCTVMRYLFACSMSRPTYSVCSVLNTFQKYSRSGSRPSGVGSGMYCMKAGSCCMSGQNRFTESSS